MNRKLFFYILLAAAFCSCHNAPKVAPQSHTSENDSIRYLNLIMGTVLDNYKRMPLQEEVERAFLEGDTNRLRNIRESIPFNPRYFAIQKNLGPWGYKEVKDSVLNLTFRMHRWHDYQPAFPNTIIYVSNGKDFEYAFPFTGEDGPRYDRYDSLVKKNENHWDRVNEFQVQLNYMANALKINYTEEELHRFISIIADSLLYLKKITVADTDLFRKELHYQGRPGHEDEKCSICHKNVQNEIETIIQELKKGEKNMYCYLGSCYFSTGFWKFEIIRNKGRVYITARFDRCECGVAMYW